MDIVKDALALIATYGLPIVLTVWFVFRIDVMMTTLANSLENFIKWMMEKENDKKEKDKEILNALRDLNDQAVESINRIKILEVKLDK